MDELLKNSILIILAFLVLIGGTITSLTLPNMLLSNQLGIYVVIVIAIAVMIMVMTLALYWLIFTKIDPESIGNPFILT